MAAPGSKAVDNGQTPTALSGGPVKAFSLEGQIRRKTEEFEGFSVSLCLCGEKTLALRFPRHRAKTVAEWRHWNWSSGGVYVLASGLPKKDLSDPSRCNFLYRRAGASFSFGAGADCAASDSRR